MDTRDASGTKGKASEPTDLTVTSENRGVRGAIDKLLSGSNDVESFPVFGRLEAIVVLSSGLQLKVGASATKETHFDENASQKRSARMMHC